MFQVMLGYQEVNGICQFMLGYFFVSSFFSSFFSFLLISCLIFCLKGEMYMSGNGCIKDDTKAFEMFGHSAKLEYAPAQYKLGISLFFSFILSPFLISS
jgi:hypothetical protein